MKKLFLLLLTGILVTGTLAGCGGKVESSAPATEAKPEAKPEDKPIRVGISLVYKGDEWCAELDEQFKKQAAAFGFDVNIQDGNIDNETQMKQIENFIVQQYDVIAIASASADGIVPAIEKAAAAGIPVIAYDAPTNYDDLISYVAWDNRETGKVLGDHIRGLIETEYGGKANIAVLTMHTPPQILDRVEGFKDALKDVPGVTYVSEQDYEGNREKAANIITNIKEPIDIIISGQDNGAWGAVSALQALNNKDAIVYSMGAYGGEPFDALKADNTNYKGTVAISPYAIAIETYQIIRDYFDGKTDIPERVNINLDLVTHDNIEEYLLK